MTHNFSDVPNVEKNTKYKAVGRVAVMTAIGLLFWIITWIFH